MSINFGIFVALQLKDFYLPYQIVLFWSLAFFHYFKLEQVVESASVKFYNNCKSAQIMHIKSD